MFFSLFCPWLQFTSSITASDDSDSFMGDHIVASTLSLILRIHIFIWIIIGSCGLSTWEREPDIKFNLLSNIRLSGKIMQDLAFSYAS